MQNDILHRLYEQYSREIYLYLYSMCNNKSMAEDLLHDTFLKAIFSLNEDVHNMRAWLYKVAKNLCINEMKRNDRVELMEDVGGAVFEDDILETMIYEAEKRKLYEAIQQLSPMKRQILTMQYFGELSQKEIANIVNLTPENVRITVHRAKKELKSLLDRK